MNDSVYIPAGTLFKMLHVDRTISLRDSTMKGFFVEPNNLYEIDFARDVATLEKKHVKFDSTMVIIGQLDFYVLPSLLNKIFKLNFSVDFNSLALSLTTEAELPIVTEYQRESRRNYLLTTPQGSFVQAPLAYPRDRSLLNGGVVDYSVTAFGGSGPSTYNYSMTGGAEILGGEAQGTIFGNISNQNSRLYSSDVSWKYVFDSTGYITNASLGNINSNGLTQYGFRGAQVSNEPVTVRTVFGKYAIDAKANPNWDVELYLNGQLVGYSKADAAGDAHFSIPLVYGSSFIQLKYYGPSGQVLESERRLQIPFTFLPAGQITYSVGGGELNNSNDGFLSADAVVGVTDWLTDKIGMDYVNDSLYSKPLFYNSLSFRMGTEYMMSIDAAPAAYYRSSFNALYPSQASFDFAYTHYQSNMLYNPSGKFQDAQADFFVPISFSSNSFNVRGTAAGQEYIGGQKAYSYSAYLNSSVSQFNASLGYLLSILDYGGGSTFKSYGVSANILYSMFFPQGRFDFVNGSLLNLSMRYGVLKTSLDDIRFEISRNIFQYVRVAIAGERDYLNRISTFNLQIVADLPVTRSTTNAQVQNGRSWFTENISGSAGYDSRYDHVEFNNLGWVGHSAASMRMFVDNNGNGVYDSTDEVINNGTVTLRQAVSSELSSDGITREWNLLPYTQYSADIDQSSIRNPLLIPKMKSFSFVTDPDSYKPIDIPFFAGGIVDGTVLKVEDTVTSSIPGLTLEMKSVNTDFNKTITVFSDGSFYFMGLPPGKYEAYVDSTQLSLLDLIATPAVLLFEVKPTRNGDYVEGLKILLKDKNPKDTTKTGRLIGKPRKIWIAAHHETQVHAAQNPPQNENIQFAALNRVPVERRHGVKLPHELLKTPGPVTAIPMGKNSDLPVDQNRQIVKSKERIERPDTIVGKFRYEETFMICESETAHEVCYAIELADFHSLGAATEFCDFAFKQIGIRPGVNYDRWSQSYSVVLAPFKTEEDAVESMTVLKENPLFRKSFAFASYENEMPKEVSIVMDEFSTNKSAIDFSREVKNHTGLVTMVVSNSDEAAFKVSTRLIALKNRRFRFWISSIKSSLNHPTTDLATIP